MSTYIITATIKSVNLQLAKTGSAGINIVLQYDDGSQWGKKIYKWFWWEGKIDNDMIKFAQLGDENATKDNYSDVFMSHKLCGLDVELQVDQTDERFWKVLEFGKVGTVKPQSIEPTPDDIPF